MADWTKSMQQTFEFYKVDPATWKDSKVIETITSCTIDRDAETSTLGSAAFESTDEMEECYIRVYLATIQNGIKERHPLGTFLVQTPSTSFDGKKESVTMDGYTPLIELKGGMPSIGYAIMKEEKIMERAHQLCRENLRAPVVEAGSDSTLNIDFVANTDDTWLTFIQSLIRYDEKEYSLALDEMGRVLFEPKQELAALQSVWTYDDGNSSILYPDIKDDRDLYDIPNAVEVVYSNDVGYLYSKVVNDDPSSPVSTVNRGREILYRVSDPNISGIPTQDYIDEYATQLLKSLSVLKHTVTYKHGYCPARLGDCVTLNYKKAGIVNVRAKVIAQSIKCTTGCPVEETAVYTTKLWR